nr:M23 family metallopeptidase [uncultured Draconibacterium sp.]
MKKTHLLSFLLILLTIGCNKENDPKLFEQGSLEPNKEVQIIFSENALSRPQNVDVSILSSSDERLDMNEISSFYDIKSEANYGVHIALEEQPQDRLIEVKILLSETYISSIPKNYGVEIFARIYADGGMETIDDFELIESSYDKDNKTLSAFLPAYIFSNHKNDNVFETVLKVAATPGKNKGSDLNKSYNNSKCEAFGIICPTGNCAVSSAFNKQRKHPISGKVKPHWGVDFAVAQGTNVKAVTYGKVERVSVDKNGYGLNIILRHDNGSVSRYCHLSKVLVATGTNVTQGQAIALSGGAKGDPNAGTSTGPHLHFEYAPNGNISLSKSRIDPMPCITASLEGGINIRDNGTLADDAFDAYLNGHFIGKTTIGDSNSIALSSLMPGEMTLKVVCTIAPDNVGTLEIILNNGILFTNGSNVLSTELEQGESMSLIIVIPQQLEKSVPFRSFFKDNDYIEGI